MKYVPFGQTGVEVSVLGFGAMRLPQREDRTCDYEASIPLLRRGLDLGITYIDSAYVYINGTSEVAVGKAIKGYDRSRLVLATKIPVGNKEEATAKVWRTKLEECLRRFDTPYIDFMHFHGLTWEAFEGWVSRSGMALEAARQAQAEGLIRHLSFSSHDSADNIIKLINTGEFASLLVQ
mgnify:CR=1 FL=1